MGKPTGFIEYLRELAADRPALDRLAGAEEAQAMNELKATSLYRALLLNFGAPSLEHKRLVLNLCESAKSADEVKAINLTGA